MRRLVVLLCLLEFTTVLYGQNDKITQWKDWKINESGSLIWQHVYDDSTTSSSLIIESLKSLAWIRNIEERDSTIFANGIDYMIATKKYGKGMSLPMLYTNSRWAMAIKVDLRRDKYRVTISSLSYNAGSVDAGMLDIPLVGNFDDEVLKKDRSSIRPGQLKNMDVFGRDLHDKFTLKKEGSETEDW